MPAKPCISASEYDDGNFDSDQEKAVEKLDEAVPPDTRSGGTAEPFQDFEHLARQLPGYEDIRLGVESGTVPGGRATALGRQAAEGMETGSYGRNAPGKDVDSVDAR